MIMDVVVGQSHVHSAAKFEISEEAGRAWVEATVDNGGTGDDYYDRTLRAKVQNLSYDTETREIIYRSEGSRVVCARVTVSKFLFVRQTAIKDTGHCELRARLEDRKDDTGFEYKTNKHLIVELKITQPQ